MNTFISALMKYSAKSKYWLRRSALCVGLPAKHLLVHPAQAELNLSLVLPCVRGGGIFARKWLRDCNPWTPPSVTFGDSSLYTREPLAQTHSTRIFISFLFISNSLYWGAVLKTNNSPFCFTTKLTPYETMSVSKNNEYLRWNQSCFTETPFYFVFIALGSLKLRGIECFLFIGCPFALRLWAEFRSASLRREACPPYGCREDPDPRGWCFRP